MAETLEAALPAPAHPLISVWTHPGYTIRQVAGTQPMRLFFPLAAVWGVSTNLRFVLQRGLPAETLSEPGISSPWVIVGANVLFGAIFGIVVLWSSSFLYAWLGKLFGGNGSPRVVRTALAWSSVAHAPILIAALLVIAIGGTGIIPILHDARTSPPAHPLRMLYFFVSAFFSIFALVMGIAGMSEVMGISRLRATGVMVLGGLLLLALVLSCFAMFATFLGG